MGDFVIELLKQLPIHVFWKNKRSVYVGCNDAFAKSLGLSSPEEVIGKTDYDLSTKKEESDAYRVDDQYVMTSLQPKLNIEEYQTLPNGKTILLLTNKVPLLKKSGEVMGVLGIYSDITERKKMEEKLNEAKEMAEAANAAKTEFLRNMRHDFRTPFTGILGLAGVMKEQETDLAKQENLKYIEESAEALLDHLNEIMEFIEIESGQLPILEKTFDLWVLLKDASKMMLPSTKKKHLDFQCIIDEILPQYVIGDRIRTHRILMNLLSNAIKFTDKGSIKLEAKVLRQFNQTIIIQFIVQDTGIGIPEEKQNIIFERFNRLTSSYSGLYFRKGAGTSHCEAIFR